MYIQAIQRGYTQRKAFNLEGKLVIVFRASTDGAMKTESGLPSGGKALSCIYSQYREAIQKREAKLFVL